MRWSRKFDDEGACGNAALLLRALTAEDFGALCGVKADHAPSIGAGNGQLKKGCRLKNKARASSAR